MDRVNIVFNASKANREFGNASVRQTDSNRCSRKYLIYDLRRSIACIEFSLDFGFQRVKCLFRERLLGG